MSFTPAFRRTLNCYLASVVVWALLLVFFGLYQNRMGAAIACLALSLHALVAARFLQSCVPSEDGPDA